MISCRLCSAQRRSLGRHLWYKHEISAEEYRDRFPGAATVDKELSANKSAHMSRRNKEAWKDHSYRARMKAASSRWMKALWEEYPDYMLARLVSWHEYAPFRSKTEYEFACHFERLGIRYEYETKRFRYTHPDGTRRWYRPDFYLPDEGVHIEVKYDKRGVTEEALAKAACVENLGLRFEFVFASYIPFSYRGYPVMSPTSLKQLRKD